MSKGSDASEIKFELDYFREPKLAVQRQYEALRAYFVDGRKADDVAGAFGYRRTTVYSLIRDFKAHLKSSPQSDFFFPQIERVRHIADSCPDRDELIIALRKQYLSVEDIKIRLDAVSGSVSTSYIWKVLHRTGFGRLPRRCSRKERSSEAVARLEAPVSCLFTAQKDEFSTSVGGLFLFAELMAKYGIDRVIRESDYPGSATIPKLNSIMAFLALKLSNFSRYSHDDAWCMDRGLGLFAGLNVLPKTAWFSSYSYRVTRDMNLNFLQALNRVWRKYGLLDGAIGLDFTTIPCWGDDSQLENNWSGKRNQAISSILAALAHSPDSGIISYGHAGIRHQNEAETVLEFLDFWRADGGTAPRYLVFDSKFTSYENLSRINADAIKFLTIRRRGKKIVEALDQLLPTTWKSIRVECAGGKYRTLNINDSNIQLKGYDGEVRQIAITGHGKIKPALLITNDFDSPAETLIRTYTRRWLVEKTIAEQIYFFHLNRVSSSIVVKVDFDLTMSILAHNMYRLLAQELTGFEASSAETLFNKFVDIGAEVTADANSIGIELKKRRNLPQILEFGAKHAKLRHEWLDGRALRFSGATIS